MTKIKKTEFINQFVASINDVCCVIDERARLNLLSYFEPDDAGVLTPKCIKIATDGQHYRDIPMIAFLDVNKIRIKTMTLKYSADLLIDEDSEISLSGTDALAEKTINIDVDLNIEVGNPVEVVERLKHDLLEASEKKLKRTIIEEEANG
ncbi:MAG: hypothetical protein J4F41_04525 [Alphaproteobacteria bacterium]|nr:hypothetical protein [Alphaproteobacteria bacterium]